MLGLWNLSRNSAKDVIAVRAGAKSLGTDRTREVSPEEANAMRKKISDKHVDQAQDKEEL